MEARLAPAMPGTHPLHQAEPSSEQDPCEPSIPEPLEEDGPEQPSGEQKKGKRASAKAVRSITIEQLIPLFSLSLDKAARALGISATSLKKVRRRLHIDAWPYRKVRRVFARFDHLYASMFVAYSMWRVCFPTFAVP